MTARIAIAGLAGTLFVAIACSDRVQDTGQEINVVDRPQKSAVPAPQDSYSNSRYGFEVTYPSGQFVPQPAPENNDGRLFHGPRGSQFRVYGSHNAQGLELSALVEHKRALFESLTEDRQEGDSWTGFGPTTDGNWMAVKLIRVSDARVLTAQFTAPRDSSMEMRETGRAMITSLHDTGGQSGS